MSGRLSEIVFFFFFANEITKIRRIVVTEFNITFNLQNVGMVGIEGLSL